MLNMMNTRFGLLDGASLFSLLVRLHYEDLMNLCKSRRYLWKITSTHWFQEKWKEYNVKTVDTDYATMEIDRLGITHGRTERYLYGDRRILAIQQYHQGLIQSSVEFIIINKTVTYTYIDGIQYDSAISHDENRISYRSNKNHLAHGLYKDYYADGRINWTEYDETQFHGLRIKWRPNGSLKKIVRYRNGILIKK